MKALDWLTKYEWSMGNGQCPDCCGMKPGQWFPHAVAPEKTYEGHAKSCNRASAIIELGGKAEYRTNNIYEIFE